LNSWIKRRGPLAQTNSKPSKIALLNPPLKESLNIEVSPANLERSLRVMDALIKVLEGMGGRVFLARNSTDVSIQGAPRYYFLTLSQDFVKLRESP